MTMMTHDQASAIVNDGGYEKLYDTLFPQWAGSLSKLPERFHGGVMRYLANGIPGGHFLDSLLRNNLFKTYERGDYNSLNQIHQIVTFLYNYAPSDCYGSDSKVERWVSRGGYLGLRVEDEA